jgi:hypothetical protein
MSTEPKPTQSDPFPVPEGIKLRARKFGANPVSQLVAAPVGGPRGDDSAPRPPFRIDWEDTAQGLTVKVRERTGGHLIVEVVSTDPLLLKNAAVSVGLVGTVEDGLIRKTIPLDVPEEGGCSGSADFGPLAAAVTELGPQIGIVAFLLV